MTAHSIDLKNTREKCFAATDGMCGMKILNEEACNSYRCPFYKPQGCRDWIRVERADRIMLVPPEEYFARKKPSEEKLPTWKVHWRTEG